MVKGVARRVIVVRTPDPGPFEEAFFLVKEDARSRGITGPALLRQARLAAEQGAEDRRARPGFLGRALWALAGAALIGTVWALTALL